MAIHLTQDFLDKLLQTIELLCIDGNDEDTIELEAGTDEYDPELFLQTKYHDKDNFFKNCDGKWISEMLDDDDI